MVLGTLGVSLLFVGYTHYYNKKYLYGFDNKGGRILRLDSKYGENELSYSREFQKNRHLMEPDM